MIQLILSWLIHPKYQDHLEAFILSKNPLSNADVEHWEKYYEYSSIAKY